jgi:hypothetical protein
MQEGGELSPSERRSGKRESEGVEGGGRAQGETERVETTLINKKRLSTQAYY